MMSGRFFLSLILETDLDRFVATALHEVGVKMSNLEFVGPDPVLRDIWTRVRPPVREVSSGSPAATQREMLANLETMSRLYQLFLFLFNNKALFQPQTARDTTAGGARTHQQQFSLQLYWLQEVGSG